MTNTQKAASGGPVPRRSVLAWALQRAAIGLLILILAVGGFAWLLHASIEAEENTVAAVTPAAEQSGGSSLSFRTLQSPRL
jgi:hypothetical protein